MSLNTTISASILSANPMQFENEIRRVEAANVDFIHIDVMDGHFVPNITMGPFIVDGVKKITDVPLDIHLMIENPDKYIESFAKAAGKGDIITFHIETTDAPHDVISMIKSFGLKAGVALNPSTPYESIEDIIDDVDLVLAMTVNPGFSGQKFIEKVLSKLEKISKMVQSKTLVEVDGGITVETAPLAIRSGANMLAAASSIFKAQNINDAVQSLRDCVNNDMQLAV